MVAKGVASTDRRRIYLSRSSTPPTHRSEHGGVILECLEEGRFTEGFLDGARV